MTASHLTVRNLPPELVRALEKEKQRRGTSLNQTVIDQLNHGVGRLAGTWTEVEHNEFLSAVRGFEDVDRDFWK